MSVTGYFDLLRAERATSSFSCELCVVGAGAAGIYLAVQLAARGVDVVLLEAGGAVCADARALGFEASFPEDPYPGAVQGRSFGVGGSTSRWGGLLIPHGRHDLRANDADTGSPWPHIVRTVAENSQQVLQRLGYPGEADTGAFVGKQLGEVGRSLSACGFEVAASLFLPFRSKNLACLLQRREAGRSPLRVVINAVAKSWTVGEASKPQGGVLQRLTAVAGNGNSVEVVAKRYLIAAGALESARILLELQESAPGALSSTASLGRYLSDHLSTAIAQPDPAGGVDVARLFAPRFSQGWMSSFRFLEAEPPPTAPRSFSHFIADNDNPGFLLAKEVLGAMQGRRWPQSSLAQLFSGLGGLLALAQARYLRKALYLAPGSNCHLQLDIEQAPDRENRIVLGSEKDGYGRPKAQIRWRIRERDLENIEAAAGRILAKWDGPEKRLPGLLAKTWGCDAVKPHDAYHPVGTCRMGSDPEAVVDLQLRVRGVRNLWLVSTAVLPSAGTANPTFTMLCLAEDLLRRLTDPAGGDHDR